MAITLVQSKKASSASASTLSVVLNSAPTAGNFLACCWVYEGDDAVTVSSNSTAWSESMSGYIGTNSTVGANYKANVTAADQTVTFLLSGISAPAVMIVAEFSGVATASPFDTTASNSTGSPLPFVVSCVSPNAQANELVMYQVNSEDPSPVWAAGSTGYSIIDGYNNLGLINLTYGYKVVSAIETSTVSVNATGLPVSPWYVGGIETFKAAATATSKKQLTLLGVG